MLDIGCSTQNHECRAVASTASRLKRDNKRLELRTQSLDSSPIGKVSAFLPDVADDIQINSEHGTPPHSKEEGSNRRQAFTAYTKPVLGRFTSKFKGACTSLQQPCMQLHNASLNKKHSGLAAQLSGR